jgi:large subunit ribosomal protein L9
MEVILLERVGKLGHMGDVVRVKDGFARNFLLPQGKALRANDANRAKFESQRHQLEARNLERKSEAEQIAAKLSGQQFVVIRQAGETGQLYGSVTSRDIAEIMEPAGFNVGRSQIMLHLPLKTIGMHDVPIALHAEVDTHVTINVARSEDEAARQARGEDVTVVRDTDDEEEAAAAAALEGEEEAQSGDETAETPESESEGTEEGAPEA